jgi:hypothetical protein
MTRRCPMSMRRGLHQRLAWSDAQIAYGEGTVMYYHVPIEEQDLRGI